MALTNQQVQQAYLAILGRPAEAEAVLWGSLATDVPGLINTIIVIRSGVDFNKDNTTFVENLYLNLLGRSSDEEGLSFWVAALNNGTSYGDLVTSFIASAASSLTDLYTLQNKLSLAEQISLQVKSIKGGAPAEAKLKEIMNTIDGETSIDDIQEDINTFLGQYNNAQKVTVKPGAEEPTQGSDEYASTYNATIKLGDENSTINIEGSSVFDDTLNLTVKGSADNNTFNSSDLGQVSNIASVNLNLRDSRLTASNIDTSHFGADTIKIKGNSADSVVVNNAMSLLDTGDGNDDITINQALDTLLAGAGNDKVVVNAKVTSLQTGAGDDNISVNSQVTNLDAGAGNDTIDLTSSAKISKLNAGAGDDIIKISQKANIKNATIDGGAGNNSLKLYDGQVDLTNTTLNGINALSGEARLKAAQLSGKTLTLGVEQLDDSFEGTGVIDTAKIELQAQTGGIDLSALTIAEDSAGHELKIVDVKNSSIKLSDDNLGNSDESDSTKVEIYGTDGNDQITLEAGKVSLLDSLKGNDTITISQAASVAILNANDGKNTISVAGKVGSLNTGADADSISVSGEVQTIKAGDGDDSIDLASSSKVSNIDAGAGNDTISVSGQVSKEINAGAGNDIININQGSKIFTLNAGEGDDTINIQRGADLNSAKIDGGSGFNSLKLSNDQVDLSKASLNNINAISGEGKLNANQVNNKSLTLGTEQTNSYGDLNGLFDSANLTIQADKSTSNLSLNNLKIAQGSTGHTLNITNVKETSISLNDQNLGNQDIDDLENYATKVNVTSTENKDNITLSNGKFATVDTSGGNDTINVESSASVATLKAGEGNDTINVKGAVKDLDASEGNDTIVLESGSTTTNINAGAGDDIVRFKSGAAAEVIDGGAGNNTLVLDSGSSVDLTNTTLKNIQVLDGDATLSVDQINGQSFILGGDKNTKVGENLSGKASLKVSVDDKNINLSNLKSADGVKDNKVELTDVTTAKITLSDAKAGIAETIKLSANASAVEISNIRGGDKIDLAALNVLSSGGGTQTPTALLSTSTSKSISSGKLYAYSLTTGSLGDIDSIVSELSSYSAAGKALLAINQDGKAHLYQVSAGKISAGSLKLLAITDAEINIGNAKVSGSAIELQGSNVVTLTKEVTEVTSANQADTVFVGAVSISGSGSSAQIDGAPTSGHSITGSANYNDTLAIDINGSGTGTKLDDGAWKKIVDPNKIQNVENLTLGANSVEVDLTLKDTNGNFQNEVTITGTSKTTLKVQQNTQKISLGSGSGDVTVSGASVGDLNLGGGDNTLKAESGGKINNVEGSSSKDTITISGSGSQIDKITTGGGDDSITLSDGGKLGTLDASSGTGTVSVSGSGSLSNITGEGAVKLNNVTLSNDQLDITGSKGTLTISGGSISDLLAGQNKITLENNAELKKLQVEDGGNVSVSGSGSVTFDTTNNTGDHAITIGKDTTLKEYKAGSGDDSIKIDNGGKLSGASIDFKNGDNILNVMSGGDISELTTITTGNGNSDITINAGATATKLANIKLGNGNNTLKVGVSGDTTNGLSVSGGSGTDNIEVLTSGKIDTLNAGANTTNLDLQTTGGIKNINANSAGSTINIKNNDQADVITKITGNSGSDIINVGKNMTVTEIETGTGALSVNGEAVISKVTISANNKSDITIGTDTKTTVTEVVASGDGSKVTLKGNGEVNKLNLSGNTTEDITIGNGVTVKDFVTDNSGKDIITVASGGKLDVSDTSKNLNFSGSASTINVENGGDISTIQTITMGDHGDANITIENGAKIDALTMINLGTAGSTSGTNALTMNANGEKVNVSGSTSTDQINVGATGKINKIIAGTNATNIDLDGGTINEINTDGTTGSNIEIKGQGTIGTITGQKGTDKVTLGDGITLGTYTGGSGDDTLNLSGATVNTISAGKDNTTISGDSTNKGEVNELKTDASTDAHNITISNTTVNKITAGTGNDTITLGEGGALGNANNTTIDLKEGQNTLTVNSGGDISALTRIDMGDNGNATLTINEGAKLGTTTIELGSAATTGTGNKNTVTLKANGENLTIQGTSSDEEINVSGADSKLGTLNVGTGKTTINLTGNSEITKIKADTSSQEIVNITGTGTVGEIIAGTGQDRYIAESGITIQKYMGNSNLDQLNLKGAKVNTIQAGSGETKIILSGGGSVDEIQANDNDDFTLNISGDTVAADKVSTITGSDTLDTISVTKATVTTLNAGANSTNLTLSGAAVVTSLNVTKDNSTIDLTSTDSGEISKLSTNGGTGTHTINVGDKIDIKALDAGTGNDILNIKNGGKISAASLDFSGGNNTLSVASGGDINTLTSINMGDNGSANITIENGAKLGTTTINLGTAGTGAKNTFTLKANGENLDLSGSSSLDEITISGNGSKLGKLNAGENKTIINLADSGAITSLKAADNTNEITIKGQNATIDTIDTATGDITDKTHTIGLDNVTVTTYNGGASEDKVTLTNAAKIVNYSGGAGLDDITISGGVAIGTMITTLTTGKGITKIHLVGASDMVGGTDANSGLKTSDNDNTITIDGSGSVTKLNTLDTTSNKTNIINLSGSASIQEYIAGQGNDTINLYGNAKLGSANKTTIDFNGGNNTLAVKENGDISALTSIAMGTGNAEVIIEKDAKLNTADATISLGNGGTNIFTMNASGDKLSVSGGDGNDTITVEGENAKLKAYTIGNGGETKIFVENGGVITDVSGANITSDILVTISGKDSDISNLTLGTGTDNIKVLSGGSILNALNLGTTNGDTVIVAGKDADGSGSKITTLNANGGTNTIEIKEGGEITTFNGGSDKDTIIVSGAGSKISQELSAGVSGGIDLDILDGGYVKEVKPGTDGQLDINVSGTGSKIETITAGKGGSIVTIDNGGILATSFEGDATAAIDSITIKTGANISGATINTNSGDDTITIESGATLTGASIDFGADGTGDKLILSGTATLDGVIAIKNVNTIDLTNSNATNLDFSKVTNASEVTIDKVNANSTITLSTDTNTKTKVVLEGKEATILNVTSGDKIDFNAVQTDIKAAISNANFTDNASTLTDKGALVWANAIADLTNKTAVKNALKNAAKDMGADKKALVAVKNTDDSKSALYLVTGNNDAEQVTCDLLGVVGHKIDNGDSIADGVINFA